MSSKQNKKGSLAIAGVLVAADKTLAYNGHKEDEVSHTDNDLYQGSSLLLLIHHLILKLLSHISLYRYPCIDKD